MSTSKILYILFYNVCPKEAKIHNLYQRQVNAFKLIKQHFYLYSLLCVDSQTTWNFKAEMSHAQALSLWRLKCKKWFFTSGFKNDSPKIKASDLSDVEEVCAYREFMVCTRNGEDGSFSIYTTVPLQPTWFSFRTSIQYDIQEKSVKVSFLSSTQTPFLFVTNCYK